MRINVLSDLKGSQAKVDTQEMRKCKNVKIRNCKLNEEGKEKKGTSNVELIKGQRKRQNLVNLMQKVLFFRKSSWRFLTDCRTCTQCT